LASTTCELQWLTYLLSDLSIKFKSPALLYCDNSSACHIACNSVFHERTKHIEIDCHVVREKLERGLIHLLSVRSTDQLADIFTKALEPLPFKKNLSKLGIIDIYALVCRGIKAHY
jgi:hypothetical protein